MASVHFTLRGVHLFFTLTIDSVTNGDLSLRKVNLPNLFENTRGCKETGKKASLSALFLSALPPKNKGSKWLCQMSFMQVSKAEGKYFTYFRLTIGSGLTV